MIHKYKLIICTDMVLEKTGSLRRAGNNKDHKSAGRSWPPGMCISEITNGLCFLVLKMQMTIISIISKIIGSTGCRITYNGCTAITPVNTPVTVRSTPKLLPALSRLFLRQPLPAPPFICDYIPIHQVHTGYDKYLPLSTSLLPLYLLNRPWQRYCIK